MANPNISLLGATYSDVPGVTLPKQGGGTATFHWTEGSRQITQNGTYDVTALEEIVVDVSGGGGATQHTIHLEFSDNTDTDIEVNYDDAWVGTLITSTEPTTYSSKTVTLAQLDGVTWYQPQIIPLNTELIDYNECYRDKAINSSGEAVTTEWYYASDFTPIAAGMTFSYTASLWHYIGFYDSGQNVISTLYVYSDGTPDPNDSNTGHGTLSGNKIPANAAYARLCGTWYDSAHISLIRTA